jgi:hypothetical protein
VGVTVDGPETMDAMKATKLLDALARTSPGDGPQEAALTEAVRVLGDYNNLGPIERDLVSKAFPIFPLTKQVGLAVAHYAEDHPLRTAFIMHQGAMAAQEPPQHGLPSWLSGARPLGNNCYFPLRSLFSPDLVTGAASSPTGFLNPLLKFGAEAGLGANPSNGAKVMSGKGSWNLTRPGGAFGRTPSGPVTDLSSLRYLAEKTPIGRLYLNEFATPEARYDTGQPRFTALGGLGWYVPGTRRNTIWRRSGRHSRRKTWTGTVAA